MQSCKHELFQIVIFYKKNSKQFLWHQITVSCCFYFDGFEDVENLQN